MRGGDAAIAAVAAGRVAGSGRARAAGEDLEDHGSAQDAVEAIEEQLAEGYTTGRDW